MATGDKINSTPLGTDYNAGEEERKRLEAEASLAAENARIGSGEAQAPETLPSPGSVNTALNQSVLIGNAQENGRAITMSDVNDPSFEGMSASEISQAINDPNYLTTGPTIPNVANFNKPQSRFGKGLDAVVDLGTKNLFSNIDTGVNLFNRGRQLSTPFFTASNYLLNPNEPSLSESYQQVRDFIPDSSLSRVINPEIGAEEMESKQQQLVKNFLADQATEKTTQEAQGQQETSNIASLPEGAQGQVATLDPTSDAAILANRARREAQFSEQGAPAAPGAIPPLQTFVGPSGTGYQKAPEGMVKAMGPDGKMVFTTPEQADQMNQSYLSELNASKQAQKDFLSSDVGQNEMTLQGMRNAAAQEQQANGGQAAQRPNLPGFNAGQNTQGSINNPSFDAGQGGQGRLKVQTVPQSSDFFQRGPTPSSDFFQRGPTPQGSLTDFGGITDIGGITDLRSMSASDDSKKMSYSDAKIRARGEFAARNIDPSPSQLRALTKSIQAAEPERLAGLKTERALNEARLQTAQAEQNKPEFRGRVYTVDGVTFAQLSNGSAQVISTGTEDPEKTTRDAEKFEFTKKKIEDARKAYEEGDLTKSNDILAAANIQQYGIQANATQYFADSTPQVTPPAPQVTGSGLTQQQEARINLVMGTNPTRSRAEVIEAMQTQGKL